MTISSFTFRLTFLAVFLSLLLQNAGAQVTANCTNCGASDYYFTIQYDFTNGYRDNNAGCGLTSRQLEGGTNNPTGCPNNVWTGIETVGQGNIINYNVVVGPGYSNNIYVSDYYSWNSVSSGCTCGICVEYGNSECRPFSSTTYFYTAPIKSPVNLSYSIVNVTSIPNLQFAQLSWSVGTDIPSSYYSYNIYRNGVLLANVPSSVTSYNDSTLLSDGTYTYSVTTYTSGITSSNGSGTTINWGTQESPQGNAYINVPIENDIMTATQGTLYGKTQLTWPNIAVYAPNGIQVSANGQQLAVVDKNATTYSDFSGVPGVTYEYSIAPINANNQTPFSFSDSGYSRPNGIIKGNVYTIYNAAVSGVTLYAFSNVNGTENIMDSTITDASGYYEFDNLFYDTSAVYTLVPHKGNHKFNPDTLTRTLSVNNDQATGVNFTDTSVFTIAGNIAFAPDPHCGSGGCHPVGVTIYSNGSPTAGVTDANGNYSFAIQTEGVYVLKPNFTGHTFSPDSIVIDVAADSFGVNFTDITTDTLFISLQGGCHNQVAYQATVSIASNNNNNYNYPVDTIRNAQTGTASQFLVIPAQPYTVTFLNAYASPALLDPNITSSVPQSITVDLTTRDSSTLSHVVTTYDTIPAHTDTLIGGGQVTVPAQIDTAVDTVSTKIEVEHRADFIYHGVISVTVPNFPLNTSCMSVNDGFIMSQNNPQDIQVLITEFYAYDSTTCPVDSGELDIYDDVSDVSGVQTVTFYNGQYNYLVQPGSPNIAPPYLKLLQFFALVGNSTANWGQEILVTGQKPHTQTFVTSTPQLPFFILHAPPGNNSFSFLSKDSSISQTYSNSYQVGGSAGAYVDANIGVGLPVPLTGIVAGVGIQITANVAAGANSSKQTDVNTTFTATQQISTASGSNNTNMYTGHMGDVYVGGSFNMIYALTNVLQLTNTCQVKLDTELAWGANGLATTYIYTEDHIVNTLIPQLQLLYALEAESPDSATRDSAILLQNDINVWQQVVQKNHRNCDTTSVFGQNISYSAGANYDNTFTSSHDSSTSISYEQFVNIDATAGVIAGTLDDFNNTAFGVQMNFQWNANKNTTNTTNITNTIGYHLEDDNNSGNYYSINVNSDAAYGTPAFVVVAGASGCPHWPGTQARDSVDLTLDNYAVSNVPINQTANFTANITNLSESGETRTYAISAVPESNPNGAIISIGGQEINNSSAEFTVAPGTSLPVLLTVAPGPVAADYTGLQVSAASACDGGEGNTITFEAHFQSDCSPIGIYSPSDNWLVNAANHDSLFVIFSGYNANDSGLINIGLEYSTPGGTWLPATNPPIPVSALTQPYYTFLFDVSNLPDGPYELRAYANCGTHPGGQTYSDILSGTINRSSLSLFGTPSPSDGVLNINDNISVTFNGDVNCAQAAVYTPIYCTLVRNDNGQSIPDSVTCNGNQLIIYTNPPSLIDSLENVTLTCTVSNVYDMYGNVLQDPITWSFMVSRSKVYWNPANLNISAVTGTGPTVTASMYNTGAQDTFTIIHMPSWLSTAPVSDYVIPTGTPNAPSVDSIQFTVSSSLNPGVYNDTVIALANGERVFLFVTLDVVSPAPNWSVNPANFQYSMNITANYSTTQLNSPLSTDTRDIIAAFVGNQCRGLGYITYDAATNTYDAFITAYSNSVVGDTFSFRMWDAVPGIEYAAVQHLPFISDGSIGQPEAPYILNPAGEFQTIPFASGWNWFSLNVADTLMTPADVLSSITGNNGAVVKTQNIYDQFTTSATGWKGSLTKFSTNTSYMIDLDHADTLHFLGQPVTDSSIIQIASGWNWVGFPRQTIADASSYLANTNPSNGDILKSQTEFTQFNSGTWAGSLNYLYPGEGYKLKSENAYNFVVPALRSLPAWNMNQYLFEQNMTVTADLQFNGVSTTESHYLVGAFANGICIGTAQPEFIPSLNLYRVFIAIQGDTSNTNQAITFQVYDTDNDLNYIPSYSPIVVVPDSIVATIEMPYVINVETTTGINSLTYTDGFSLMQNVPNPFSKTTSIDYTIPSAQQVTITLYDESGRLIRELINGTQAAGNHSISFEQDDLQSGVYFYQMKAGEFVKTRRMLILQ